MVEILKEVVKINKKGQIEEGELFEKIKTFLTDEKTEYASFALTTMMVDAMTSGTSIFKVTHEIPLKTPIQENFIEK